MNSLSWKAQLETRLHPVDEDHQHLVGLVNRLGELMEGADVPDPAELERAFGELAEHGEAHFRTEETLMEEMGVDPRHAGPHRLEHQAFKLELRDRAADARNAEGLRSLHAYLSQWFVIHILHTDLAMARQVWAIRDGCKPEEAFEAESARAGGESEDFYLEAIHGLNGLLSQRNRQLAELNRTLEGQVEARTRALEASNQDLQRALDSLRRNQEILIASEVYFRDLFDESPVGFALNRLSDGVFVAVNAAFARVTGRGMQELNTLSYWDLTPREYEPQEALQLEALRTAGRYGPYEKEYFHKDGHRVPVVLNGSRVRDPEGTPLILSVVADISARKAMEQALRNESLKNAALLRNGSDGIHILDLDGNVVEASDSFCALLGYAREEVLGMNVTAWDAMFASGDLPKTIQAQYRGQVRTQFTTLHRRKDGSTFEVEISGQPLELDGRPLMFYASRDITDRKEAEETLKSLNRQLSRTVSRLEQSNLDLEQFAFVASHDLRAPLRAIESLSQWLEEDLGEGLPEDSARNLQLLRGRVQRMEALLDGILDFSRAATLPNAAEEVDVKALVEDIADLIQAPEKADLVLEGLPVLCTAEAPLRQVFQNLIANAIKHHDGPRARITVRGAEKGDVYVFTVADDGPGIPEAFRDKVFGLFQTLKPRDQVEGSGIGLAVVRKLVVRFGGRIWIEDAQPRGAVFGFTWPRTPHPDPLPAHDARTRSRP
jgi:hemerythrin-like metal-binding protein/PAS domain S-box-containing protein